MRTHDDRAGGAGGYPDDRRDGGIPAGAGATTPARATAPVGATGSTQHTQGIGKQSYDYYDDDTGYSSSEATSLVSPRDDSFYDETDGRGSKIGMNAGADLGLLVLRLALGGLFILHGAQKLFGTLGGPGPEEFARSLAKMGFQQSGVLSLVTGATELGGGALLVLGLFTPLAAAGIVGVMVNVVLLQLGKGFFAPSGIEFPAALGAMALGLMFAGPGRVALDNGRAWFRHPVISGFVCLLIAAGSSAGVFFLLHR